MSTRTGLRSHHNPSEEIELVREQANQSPFPPECPVYILYENESPPGIDAQGVVSSVVLVREQQIQPYSHDGSGNRRRRSMAAPMTYTECYRVNVKCKNNNGEFCSREELLKNSQLRFRNGCTVYVNLNQDQNHSNSRSEKDENYHSNRREKRQERENDDRNIVTKEGIVLGFCDMPPSAKERGEDPNNAFWYCVQIQESNGEQSVHHVLPEQIEYRAEDTASYDYYTPNNTAPVKETEQEYRREDAAIRAEMTTSATTLTTTATNRENGYHSTNMISINGSKNSYDEAHNEDNLATNKNPVKEEGTVAVPKHINLRADRVRDDMSISLTSSNSINCQTKKDSPKQYQRQNQQSGSISGSDHQKNNDQQRRYTTENENQQNQNLRDISYADHSSRREQPGIATTTPSSPTLNSSNNDEIVLKNNKDYNNKGKNNGTTNTTPTALRSDSKVAVALDSPLESNRNEKKNHLREISPNKFRLTLPVPQGPLNGEIENYVIFVFILFGDICYILKCDTNNNQILLIYFYTVHLVGYQSQHLNYIMRETKCKSFRILNHTANDSFVDITADNRTKAYDTASFIVKELKTRLPSGNNRLKHVYISVPSPKNYDASPLNNSRTNTEKQSLATRPKKATSHVNHSNSHDQQLQDTKKTTQSIDQRFVAPTTEGRSQVDESEASSRLKFMKTQTPSASTSSLNCTNSEIKDSERRNERDISDGSCRGTSRQQTGSPITVDNDLRYESKKRMRKKRKSDDNRGDEPDNHICKVHLTMRKSDAYGKNPFSISK